MTDDQLFGETDFEEKIKELEEENKKLRKIITEQAIRVYCQDEYLQSLNAFLVERGLAEEYIRWKKDSGDD